MSTFVVKSDLISVATTSPVLTSAFGVFTVLTVTGLIVIAVGATGLGSTMRTPTSEFGENGFFGLKSIFHKNFGHSNLKKMTKKWPFLAIFSKLIIFKLS